MADIRKNSLESRVIQVIRDFLIESGNESLVSTLNVQAALEDDLGIDSIGRAEISRMIEKTLSVTIADQSLLQAETIQDLVKLVGTAQEKKQASVHVNASGPTALAIPKEAKTLLQVLEHYCEVNPDKVHIFLQEEDDRVNEITYGQLQEKAKLVAQGLIDLGIGLGETVAIMLPTCEEFFYAFFGVLYAGAIPVPIYPPFRASEIERYVMNEQKILNNAEARALITFERVMGLSRLVKTLVPSLKRVVTVDGLYAGQPIQRVPLVKADDPALIQYTSGSTGDPKGVLLLHQNLLTNLEMIGKTIQVTHKDVIVSWLPLYHDMGLIGAWLGSLYYGLPLVLHSPVSFLTHPERWLWSIHRYRGTISASPNFGYEFCIRKIQGDEIQGLDLSAWRIALSGAEAVRPNTIRHFIEKFKPYHFNQDAFFPAYGLAENSVALALPNLKNSLLIEKINREIFSNENRAQLETEGGEFLEFVACGKVLPEHEIRIVNDNDELLADRQIGHIQFRGPSSMVGYFHNPAAMQKVSHKGWWDTGDMGYLADGNLFPTGRKKDLIIKAGHNIYPDDIESTVSELSMIHSGGVIVFGVEEEGTEKIVVVAEVNPKALQDEDSARKEIIKKVKDVASMPPDKVVLVPPKTVPKTSSGKLQRSVAKSMYLKKQLKPVKVPVWWQLSKLIMKGAYRSVLRAIRFVLRFVYTIYAGLIAILLFFPLWLCLFIFPVSLNAKLAKAVSRAQLFLMGCRLKVYGKKIKEKPVIYVANHTSFFDTIVLQAVVPAGTIFLAKKELLKVPIIRSYIKLLGHLVISRSDFRHSEEERDQINHAIHVGKSLLIYPEGTFTFARGVQHFKLGAFTIAAEHHLSVCPVSLCGTRKILRGAERLLSPGKVVVTFCGSFDTSDEQWRILSRLRDHARDLIVQHSGEEKLG